MSQDITVQDLQWLERHATAMWRRHGYAADQSDYVSEGLSGLARAARTYDRTRGAWSTWRGHCVYSVLADFGRRSAHRAQHEGPFERPAQTGPRVPRGGPPVSEPEQAYEYAVAQELWGRILRWIQTVPQRQYQEQALRRLVAVLEGYTPTEVARQEQGSHAAVAMFLANFRQRWHTMQQRQTHHHTTRV